MQSNTQATSFVEGRRAVRAGEYRLSLVIPALNEEESIRQAIHEAVAALGTVTTEYEIIVVDDGSMSRTAEIIRAEAATNPRVLFPAQLAPSTKMGGWFWVGLVLLALVAGGLLFPYLSYPLFEPDEGRYAEIAREMLASGDWVVPTLNYEHYVDKPPLLYWLVAGGYKLSESATGRLESSRPAMPY